MAAAMSRLKIDDYVVNKPFKAIFYKKISSGEGSDMHMHLQPLLLLSILLGTGKNDEKAIELFDAFD